jgi:hypothetical protein
VDAGDDMDTLGQSVLTKAKSYSHAHSAIKILWAWFRRRHIENGKNWVQKKYFREPKHIQWPFHEKTDREMLFLINFGAVKIEKHIKVRSAASRMTQTYTNAGLSK